MTKREEIQRAKGIVADTAKMILESRICNLDLCFDIIQSEQITLSTDITDHIVEDHTSVQDHITIKPRTFTMKGLITEKVYMHPDSVEIDLPEEPLHAKLAKLAVLAPTVSSYAYSAYNLEEAIGNKINQFTGKIGNLIDAGMRKVLKFLGYKPSVNLTHNKWSEDMLQLTIITLLDTCRTNRIPVRIQTGWGDYYENMYITDISVTQGDTYQQSELSVTVKELRFTDVKMVKVTNEDLRNLQQSQEMNDTVTGTGKPSSGMYNTLLDGYGKYKR